jgi:hypothetical protein
VYSSSMIASITRSVSSSCRRWAAKGFGELYELQARAYR